MDQMQVTERITLFKKVKVGAFCFLRVSDMLPFFDWQYVVRFHHRKGASEMRY
jgi:hypothetical protein